MNNSSLAEDYKARAKIRRKMVEFLIKEHAYADAVRETQEATELALKALIRESGYAAPYSHDVSSTLIKITTDLPLIVQPHVERLCEISRNLRRDRELAFYGSEDVTPSEFYQEKDALNALAQLDEVLKILAI